MVYYANRRKRREKANALHLPCRGVGIISGSIKAILQFCRPPRWAGRRRRAALGAWAAALVAATAGENKYFRSDHGVAGPAAGALPADLNAPAALRWRVPLPPGHSSPIVSGGRIFLTTYTAADHELATVALDEATGRQLWRRPIKVSQVERTHSLGSPATATPACDGERVFAFFGSHGLLAYDLSGRPLWEFRAGPFQDEYGAASSPILAAGRVILNQDHDKDSFLLAVDAATGHVAWRVPRPDAVRSYSTPAVWQPAGGPELLVAGALELAGYDPTNGARKWWIGGLARIVIPTPLPVGDTIYMASWAPGGDPGRRLGLDAWPVALQKWDANGDGKLTRAEIKDPEVLDRFFRIDVNQDGALDQAEWERHARYFSEARNSLLAIRPTGKGELPPDAVTWRHPRGSPYVASPVALDGIVYMVKEGGIVTKLDSAKGDLLQEERVPGIGNYFASPVAGDGKVYLANESGVLTVLAAQKSWQVIGTREFHEKIYATPAFGAGTLFVRTEAALYAFQTQP